LVLVKGEDPHSGPVEDLGAALFEQLSLLRGPTLGGDTDRHPIERTIRHESILAPP